MEFVTDSLGDSLLGELKTAKKAIAAVAFFNPDEAILAAIKKVPRVTLVVADDFQINNPYKLESLCRSANWVRAVRAEAYKRKLHSKVVLIERRDGSRWAIVGSANLTRAGLYSNQEACVVFDSRQRDDGVHISIIETWLVEICSEDHPEIDFEVAKAVYDTRAKPKARSYSRGGLSSDSQEPLGHWALKPGQNGEFWQEFLAENVHLWCCTYGE